MTTKFALIILAGLSCAMRQGDQFTPLPEMENVAAIRVDPATFVWHTPETLLERWRCLKPRAGTYVGTLKPIQRGTVELKDGTALSWIAGTSDSLIIKRDGKAQLYRLTPPCAAAGPTVARGADVKDAFEFAGKLESGKTFRAEIAYDRNLRGWRPVPRIRLPHHHSGGVEWLNLDDFPRLNEPKSRRKKHRVVFEVVSEEVVNMSTPARPRWNTTYRCRILHVASPR